MALMQFVEDTYPEPALLPDAADKVKRALAYQRLHETTSLYSILQPMYYVKVIGAVNTEEEQVNLTRLVPFACMHAHSVPNACSLEVCVRL